MPFKSKAQWRACFAKNDPNWDCGEWADSTPSYKELPKKKKQEKKAESQEDIFEAIKQHLPAEAQHASGGMPDVKGLSDVDISLYHQTPADVLSLLPENTTIRSKKDDTGSIEYAVPGYSREVNVFATPDKERAQRAVDHRNTTIALREQQPALYALAKSLKEQGQGTEQAWADILGIKDDPYVAMRDTKAMLAAADKKANLDALLAAKKESDRKNYSAKHDILRKLIIQNPDNFIIDSADGNISGITHTPTGFQIHMPSKTIPAGVALKQANSEIPYLHTLAPKWKDKAHVVAALRQHLLDASSALGTNLESKELADLALITDAYRRSHVPQALLDIRKSKFKAYATHPALKQAALKPDVVLQPHQERILEEAGPDTRKLLYHTLGSGKTLSAIAAAEAMKAPYGAVVPAALRANFAKEREKFTDEKRKSDTQSYTMLSKGVEPVHNKTVIFDEAHRLRNPKSKQTIAAKELANKAQQLYLLSGSPIVNAPSDLAPLAEMLTQQPMSIDQFNAEFLGAERIDPSLWQKFRGMKPGVQNYLKQPRKFNKLLEGKVDYHQPATPSVKRIDEDIFVDMGPEQQLLHKAFYNEIPRALQRKLEKNFPLSKSEAKNLLSFLSGPRQVALSTHPWLSEKQRVAAGVSQSPKLQRAMAELEKQIEANPKSRTVVFSNFIDAGLKPYAAALEAKKIPYGIFHGGLTDKQRADVVNKYNSGELRALLLGPAASEGISLSGTNLMQLLDPHWNEARLEQAVGRGIRFDSHGHLPEEEQKVRVQRYISKLPKGRRAVLSGFKRPTRDTADTFLQNYAHEKQRVNDLFLKKLRQIGTPKEGGMSKDDAWEQVESKETGAGAKYEEKQSSASTLAKMPLGLLMADIIVKSYKQGSYSKYGSMLQNAQQQVAAQNPANQGVPGADPNEVARQLLASRNPAAQNPANQGVPGSDPNAVAKQLLASTGAVAAAPTSALPGPGLGMLQGYNQPGPLGTSLASSQLGTLPGGVSGAGRSVGEAGPMKMAAKLPYRERVELYARDPRGRIFSGLYSNDRTPGVPGGGVDAGEDPTESAAREFKEEVGHLVRDVQMLDVPVFDQAWNPPYMNEKQKERAKRYSGSRTRFATGVYDPAQKEIPVEPWGSKYIMPRKPSTMLKGLNLSHDDPDTADRMAARKRAVEEVIRLLSEKTASTTDVQNKTKMASVQGLFAGLEKRAVLGIAPHVPQIYRAGKQVIGKGLQIAGTDPAQVGLTAAFADSGATPGVGASEARLTAELGTRLGSRAARRVAPQTTAAVGQMLKRNLPNVAKGLYNPLSQRAQKKVLTTALRRGGNKIGGRVAGAIASKIPVTGLVGGSSALLATPFNALMEGADAVGALPQIFGGTGWGNVGWSDSNEFRRHTTPGFGDNARIMGFKDPTGGALDYAGSALNAWAKPVRTVANIADGAYKLPQEIYGAATSGPSAEAVQQSENYMKKLEADGVSSRWAVGQMPGQGRRPADDPLTKRDTLYQQAIDQGMDRNAAQDHAIAGAAGFPVEGIAAYDYRLAQGMSPAESAADAKRYAVAMQQYQQQQQQQQQQAAQGGEVVSPGTHPGGMSGFAKQFLAQTQQSPPQQQQQVAQTQQR